MVVILVKIIKSTNLGNLICLELNNRLLLVKQSIATPSVKIGNQLILNGGMVIAVKSHWCWGDPAISGITSASAILNPAQYLLTFQNNYQGINCE